MPYGPSYIVADIGGGIPGGGSPGSAAGSGVVAGGPGFWDRGVPGMLKSAWQQFWHSPGGAVEQAAGNYADSAGEIAEDLSRAARAGYETVAEAAGTAWTWAQRLFYLLVLLLAVVGIWYVWPVGRAVVSSRNAMESSVKRRTKRKRKARS